jgi:hypothetical protein
MLVSASDALEEVEDSLDSLAATLRAEAVGACRGRRCSRQVATMTRWVRAEQPVF